MRSWLFIALSLSCSAIRAQYVPNNTQAFQFSSLYNPAFTGIEHFGDMKLSYRYQWSGFGKYAPKFINLGYNSRIKQPLDLSYNSLRISDPSRIHPENLPRQKRIIHGLGGNIFQSKIGVIESLGAGVTYSINIPYSSTGRFALGVGAILENRKIDLQEIKLRDADQFYNHLLSSSASQTDLNIRAGALLYNSDFYLGFSYLPLINTALMSSDIAFDKPFYRGSIQAGYAIPVNPDLTFKSSIVALLHMNNKMSIDYNLKAFIQNKVWVGVTYRDVKSGAGLLGFNFNEKFTMAYSYELSLGEFQQFSDGSHELVLSVRFNNFKGLSQYTW
jgi:type IX secretion system PorP/SprF family membrane protein